MITSVEPELGGVMTILLLSAFASILLLALWSVSEFKWAAKFRIPTGFAAILACTATGIFARNLLGGVATSNEFYYGAYAPLTGLLTQSVAALQNDHDDTVLSELRVIQEKTRFGGMFDAEFRRLAENGAARLRQLNEMPRDTQMK